MTIISDESENEKMPTTKCAALCILSVSYGILTMWVEKITVGLPSQENV
jgi:hypothetical protein